MPLVENAEYLPENEIAAIQQQGWDRQRLHVSKNSDFFKSLWGRQSPPERLEDITALPLCDKSMLRVSQAARPPFGNYLAAADTAVSRLHRTSGTTGQAMNLALSQRDSHITAVVVSVPPAWGRAIVWCIA